MLKKSCPTCHKSSYGSTAAGKWICPTCNRDLTHIKHKVADNHKEKPQLFVIKSSKNIKSQPEITPYIFKSFD